ncbi:hypothetical protein BCR39DRAFT_504199 [Naematelia encephala]|uniref:Uncharacterized protein n=1 Tax=Naematelia encephala TaxID=71784 RepID=A0A1Y2BEI5_9TREE|nr:hypothetical protein BCR39DRAFT_504199 [Naematelia encephala]
MTSSPQNTDCTLVSSTSPTLPEQYSDLVSNNDPPSTLDPSLALTIPTDTPATYEPSYPSVLHSGKSDGIGNDNDQNDTQETDARSESAPQLDIVFGSTADTQEFVRLWMGLDNETDHDPATKETLRVATKIVEDNDESFLRVQDRVYAAPRLAEWVLCLSEVDKLYRADEFSEEDWFERATLANLRVRDTESDNGFLLSPGWLSRKTDTEEERSEAIRKASQSAFKLLVKRPAGAKAKQEFFSVTTEQMKDIITTVISKLDQLAKTRKAKEERQTETVADGERDIDTGTGADTDGVEGTNA